MEPVYTYDRACRGWRDGEPTLSERYPWAVGSVLVLPWLAAAIAAINFIGR